MASKSSVLWRGDLATRLRIVSGLILFAYVLLHFLNIGMGLVSPGAMDAFQSARQQITRSLVGSVLLYGALLTHAVLALAKLAGRRTLRMPLAEATQIAMGLIIPFLLAVHIVFTRGAFEQLGVEDRYGYLIRLIWGTGSGWKQAILLVLVWIHSCIGLHMWLRPLPGWRRNEGLLSGLAVFVPVFALAGYVTEGRRLALETLDPERFGALQALWNWPDGAGFALLLRQTDQIEWLVIALFALTAGAFLLRQLIARRSSVRVSYVYGPSITARRGATLLEMSRSNAVPHTALCGGRGRCTTCRVIIETGAEALHPPSDAEARSLQSVGAPAGTRLACQIRPTAPLTVFRVFPPDGKRKRAPASQGQEKQLAVLFLDMRGFTARTDGLLPYDVVFLLNRFFDAIVPAITEAGGSIDKYMGDGLLAVFETADPASSARSALHAAQQIGEALEHFNAILTREESDAVAIGMGLHLGDVVLGEIGAAGNAPRTLIGEAVNTASRLEGRTKSLAVELIVSQAVLSTAGVAVDPATLVALELRGLRRPLQALPVARAKDLAALLTP